MSDAPFPSPRVTNFSSPLVTIPIASVMTVVTLAVWYGDQRARVDKTLQDHSQQLERWRPQMDDLIPRMDERTKQTARDVVEMKEMVKELLRAKQ